MSSPTTTYVDVNNRQVLVANVRTIEEIAPKRAEYPPFVGTGIPIQFIVRFEKGPKKWEPKHVMRELLHAVDPGIIQWLPTNSCREEFGL